MDAKNTTAAAAASKNIRVPAATAAATATAAPPAAPALAHTAAAAPPAIDTDADSGPTTAPVRSPSSVEILPPLGDEHCTTGLLLRLFKDRPRTEQERLIADYAFQAPALAQDILEQQRAADAAAAARLLLEEHADKLKDLRRQASLAQSTSTAAQRALEEGHAAAMAAQRQVRQLEDHVRWTTQVAASSVARLSDHQAAPPSADHVLRPHLSAPDRAMYVIPRKSDRASSVAATAAPTPPCASSPAVPAAPAMSLQLAPHEQVWLSRSASDYTGPFRHRNHLNCSRPAWNLVSQRMLAVVADYVDQGGFFPDEDVSGITMGQLVLLATIGDGPNIQRYVKHITKLFTALRAASDSPPGATTNGNEDDDMWTPATSTCRAQKKYHRSDDDDNDGGNSRRRQGGGGSSSGGSGSNRPPRKSKGKHTGGNSAGSSASAWNRSGAALSASGSETPRCSTDSSRRWIRIVPKGRQARNYSLIWKGVS